MKLTGFDILFLLILFVSISMLVSCGDDDGDSPVGDEDNDGTAGDDDDSDSCLQPNAECTLAETANEAGFFVGAAVPPATDPELARDRAVSVAATPPNRGRLFWGRSKPCIPNPFFPVNLLLINA